MNIHCVSIATDDLPRATAFYKAWLKNRYVSLEESEDLTVFFFANKTSLVLYPRKDIENHTKRHATPSPNEFIVTYFAPSTQEVDVLLKTAAALGAEITEPAEQKPWGYTGIFLDPDNHAWEINHNPHVPV